MNSFLRHSRCEISHFLSNNAEFTGVDGCHHAPHRTDIRCSQDGLAKRSPSKRELQQCKAANDPTCELTFINLLHITENLLTKVLTDVISKLTFAPCAQRTAQQPVMNDKNGTDQMRQYVREHLSKNLIGLLMENRGKLTGKLHNSVYANHFSLAWLFARSLFARLKRYDDADDGNASA